MEREELLEEIINTLFTNVEMHDKMCKTVGKFAGVPKTAAAAIDWIMERSQKK